MIPDDLKGEDDYDETLDDIWPKRVTEVVEIIPDPGVTPYASESLPDYDPSNPVITKDEKLLRKEEDAARFWMRGDYTSIEALTGELTFEMNVTLVTPKQNDNWIYMLWF